MPQFKYVAVERNGNEKKGNLEAPNIEAAKMMLRNEGKIPLSIEEPNLLNRDINFSIGNPVKPRELAVFCKQFESILQAGVTAINALQMLSEQTENKVFQKSIKEVQIAVEKGETLAEAMAEQKKVFPSILINMVAAGESSGSLETAFKRMAIHFEKDAKIKASVGKAMIYPSIILIVIIAVVGFMMTVIIPKFMESFEQMNMQLPALTLAVMAISHFFQKYWYMMILAVIAIVVGAQQFKKTEAGALFFGRLGLKLPLFGNLTIKSASARLTRTLSTLLGAGITMVDGVEIVAKIMTNEIVKRVMLDAVEEVQRGVPLSQPLEDSGVFPPMVYHMTKIGEETGNMEDMLDTIANYYEEEVEIATQALTAVMEPMIIIVMAVVVVPIILAIMLPMMNIYSGVEGM